MRGKKITLAAVLVNILFSSGLAVAYDLPLGIPDPGFGIDEIKPSRPNPWASEHAGYYYVEDIGGCSDSRAYGYPGLPRCSVPDPAPAGAYVEIHGTYSRTVGGITLLHGNGTSINPVWFVGESDQERPTLTKHSIVYGTYVYLEHINWKLSDLNSALQTGRTREGYKSDHIMVRNCLIEGNQAYRTYAINTIGFSEAEATEHLVVADNIIRNHGSLAPEDDEDAHCISINKPTFNTWILNNDISACSGSGIQVGQENPTTYETDVVNTYIGGNHIHDNRQAGVGVKSSSDTVISSNDIHDQITRWEGGVEGSTVASPSKSVGWKGRFEGLWIINNEMYNNSYGVHGGSTELGAWDGDIYIIGNIIHDIEPNNPAAYSGDNPWNEAGLSLVGGTHVYAVNNTLYNVCSGIMTPTNGRNYYLENNIISNVTGNNGKHISIEVAFADAIVKNSVIYQPSGSEVIQWGSANNYTVPQFQAATGKGQGCVNTDPQFVSTSDLHIQNGSPAQDTGLLESGLSLNVYAKFQTDFGQDIRVAIDQVIKPQGNSLDMGAFEVQIGDSGGSGISSPDGFALVNK